MTHPSAERPPRTRRRRVAAAAGGVILLLGLAPAGACGVSVGGIAFGSYDPFDPAGAASSASITIDCDLAPPPDVTVGIGPSAVSGGFLPRELRRVGGEERLAYNLFVDPATTRIWGDGTGIGETVWLRKVTRNTPAVLTVHARLPPGQNAAVGYYEDRLTITVEW
ncbi:Csu type fimbrial protein [Thioalbus denitrificans]|uniref:Spore coat protein U-like protein n=1 Tax=Thioalbus denitrificans TaxID=547122 RepID=A0A369CKP3_9GAMM|nr:spore coat U domain-containing protein [Thioalbus denitrificans]RCX33246.1 spore coat protein U-like protein [Thioalbus denitrificans]